MAYMNKSKTDEWTTPVEFYNKLHHEFNFDFDPCPVNEKFDGLNVEWEKLNYVNPPYSLLKEFVQKALDEQLYGNETILLLPTKTDQQWFHDLIKREADILWIKGRLKFKNNKWSATQPHFLARLI